MGQQTLQLIEKLQRLGHVVPVVLVGNCRRLGYYDPSRHMDGALEVGMVGDDASQKLAVCDVTSIKEATADEGLRTG